MTAVQTVSGGGYGLGFLSFLKSPAWGIDYGQDGATTVSFVQGGVQGNWTAVIDALDDAKGEYEVFVPIMVGFARGWQSHMSVQVLIRGRVVWRQRPESCCK